MTKIRGKDLPLAERSPWRNRMLAAEAEIAKRQWQPIETAPKDGTELLLFVPSYIRGARRMEGPIVIGAWVEDHAWGRAGVWWSDICDPYEGHSGTTSDPVDLEPTHWMTLPEAPK